MTATDLIKAAKTKNATIVTAESCTGGMLSGAITDIAGSSAVFERGFVTYSNLSKIQLLGVAEKTLIDHGAVSEEVAKEMATGALARSRGTLSVAITGVAGPGASDRKPEGMICFGYATSKGAIAETMQFGALGRDQVRSKSVTHALARLTELVNSAPPN